MAVGIMRACSPRRLVGPWLLCLCWPAAGAEAAGVEISPRGAALPARPRRAKVMRREQHASLATDGAAVGVGYLGAVEKLEESQDSDPGDDPADEPVSLDDEGGEAEREEDDPEDGTGPGADGEGARGGERGDAPALVKAPFHFVHFSGPANRVCKGHSLWTGKAADEDECEQKCADLEACRFISLSSGNWCRLTATCDATWRQDGKKVWIFSRSRPALVQARREAATTTEAADTTTEEADPTPDPTEAPTEAATTTEASSTDTSSTDDKVNASNVTNVTEVAKLNTTDNATNETEVVKVNTTDNATNETEVVKVNGTSETGVKEEVFAQQCQDQADPGIEFVNGTTATCPMLRHYCHHPQFGELVRDNCPRACGFCAVELEENATDNKSNGSTCRDGEPSDLPRYEEAGHTLSCTMLQHYCELDVSVKMKCKRTCGWCDNPGELVRPDTELTKANKTNATGKAGADPEGWGVAYNACSRRRLLGFCHTRRRRVA